MDFKKKGFSCHMIENYRSVLDRKQPEISTWKLLDHHGHISFTRGSRSRRDSDVLAIRLNDLYLIHPWYEYVNLDQHFLARLQPNQATQILEVVLLERRHPTSEQEFDLAIVECPCLEQRGTLCSYCQCTLTAMEEAHLCTSRSVMRSVGQQTLVSFSLDFFHDQTDTDGQCHRQWGPGEHQRTVAVQVQSEIVRRVLLDYETNLRPTRKLSASEEQSTSSSVTMIDVQVRCQRYFLDELSLIGFLLRIWTEEWHRCSSPSRLLSIRPRQRFNRNRWSIPSERHKRSYMPFSYHQVRWVKWKKPALKREHRATSREVAKWTHFRIWRRQKKVRYDYGIPLRWPIETCLHRGNHWTMRTTRECLHQGSQYQSLNSTEKKDFPSLIRPLSNHHPPARWSSPTSGHARTLP